jgi:4-alpha-glucanotransferase
LSDERLIALATEAGLMVRWTDASGRSQKVGNDTLKSVLHALGLPAGTSGQIADSRARLRHDAMAWRPLIIARAGEQVQLPACRHAELVLASGKRRTLHLEAGRSGTETFRAPREHGYHRLECDGEVRVLAITPTRCLGPQDIVSERRLAGLAVQVYALRGGTSGSFGDFAALASFAERAGRFGVDAIMASPTHALFGADPGQFGPYSPSTRLFLNPLFADATLAGGPARNEIPTKPELIDWNRAGPEKYRTLRQTFEEFRARGNTAALEAFSRNGGESLLTHAIFEALDARFRAGGILDRRNWPAGFKSPRAASVRAFVRGAAIEIEYQLFLQWLAALSAEAAQKAARRTMPIGIITDIAVGMDPQGSHAWSAPDDLLRDLHVGAPPDAFHTRGQDWGLATLSPRALELSGFAPFIATLRAAMRHAGGVRIDHALGLRRLWLVPKGAPSSDGVYLRYPQRELLSLIALESHLNRAIVIGEDLGTVPDGFRDDLALAGVLGMQVLWFERGRDGQFVPPGRWRRGAVATTTTHDLPTVSGWWSENDIDWQQRANCLPDREGPLRVKRAEDRAKLWSAFRRARCASGAAPPRDETDAPLSAALGYVGRTPCPLAFAAVEDIAAVREQPNMPVTIDEHPNWRRRMRGDPLRDKRARALLKVFVSARRAP